ncbi:hypothetical protein [uncultured Cyclobacterium sp.]|uniref:hypothetical protein n=1 Tax=uncultured Cyclobacterium sp. TaxID=453820 RepID=UPI0030EF3B32|tara:strand:+ start:300140 stop:300934 length:795 start_codon:yes stop_codon:yes gene_type:complete
MSTTQYQLVFKIDISHSYFNGDKKAPFTLIPSLSSRQSMSRLNFLVNKREGGMDLFAASPSPLSDYLKAIILETGIEYFDFDIISEDTYFTFYTDFPVDRLGFFQYSSDDELNQTENEITLLHPVFKEGQIDSAVGSLRIGLNALIPALEAGGNVHFNINFKTQSIQYQYNILNNSGPLTEMSIASDSGIQFSGPTKVVLHNGQSAMRYDSKVLIPLRQKPEHSFDLVQDGKIIFKGLPHPDPAGLYKNETDTRLLSAPMFVYL